MVAARTFNVKLVAKDVRSFGSLGSFLCADASVIGKYWNAVDLYLNTGDDSALDAFQGKYIIDADGGRFFLMTNIRELDRLGSAGNLSFESLYARVA